MKKRQAGDGYNYLILAFVFLYRRVSLGEPKIDFSVIRLIGH